MAAPRLPFLWPIFFRPLKISRPVSRIARRGISPSRSFVASARTAQESNIQRYGTAHEPAAHLREQPGRKEQDDQAKPPIGKKVEEPVEKDEEETLATPSSTSRPKTAGTAEAPTSPAPDPPRVAQSKPLDTVLHMPSPAEEEQHKPPHLKTPPYVHHFDTFSLVKQLANGGFSPEQSVTIMKAVRGILTDNMELARNGLVSKSSVENETYLFRAACSELRTEVGNNRKSQMEKMRSERTQLQHEVDILNQRLGQESGHLKDELKGLFDDRKMAVRQEQRTVEAKAQQLNYKITVTLNSDARSEVEALRWVLTRRAAMTIVGVAFTIFLGLRYSSYVAHTRQEDKKKAQENNPPPDQNQGNPPSNGTPLGDQQALGGEFLAVRGGVSLG